MANQYTYNQSQDIDVKETEIELGTRNLFFAQQDKLFYSIGHNKDYMERLKALHKKKEFIHLNPSHLFSGSHKKVQPAEAGLDGFESI